MKFKKIWMSVVTVAVLACLTVLPVLALTGQVTTASNPLRVRNGPGTGYDLLYVNGEVVQLPKGTAVNILGTYQSDRGDTTNYPVWYQISAVFNGTTVTGYVAANYITLDPESTTPPVSGDDLDIYSVPEAYRPYLKPLMEAHPNWKFTFYDTGLDWNTVMDNECYRGEPFRNVVSPSSDVNYRYKDANGNYLKSSEGWYQASDAVVAYYMDPRNLMTESRIFQFELLSFSDSVHTVAGVEAILAGSFMANTKITADDGRSITYAQAIFEAGQAANASPYYLAAKIIQEVGRNGSGSTSGAYIAKDGTDCRGYYNFYNIQATSSTNDPVKQGLQWAAKSDSDESKNYGRPWTTPYKSIVGGAKYITKNYISRGQDSLYLQKFDVDNSDGSLYWHQYMTNVAGAVGEANILYKGYVSNEMLNNDFIFAIPLYENLPANRCRLPGDTSVDPAPIPDPDPDVTDPTEPDVTEPTKPDVTDPTDPDVTEPTDPDVTDPTKPDVTDPTDPSKPVASKLGDVNGDGQITAVDARWALQAASGVRTLTEQQKANADVNGDGNITAVDARWILQAASGIRDFD